MILQEEIDDKAVEYIKAVEQFGGELSYGDKNHEELINTKQTKIDNYWHDKPSKWHEGKKSAWDLGLMEQLEVSEGYYFREKISKKGRMVLSQL